MAAVSDVLQALGEKGPQINQILSIDTTRTFNPAALVFKKTDPEKVALEKLFWFHTRVASPKWSLG